ncbi:MAG: hypothetical protein K2X45_13855 [Phreatobacter sp.]|nr:hypothetical protein [Phreatobacter sp.]
MPRNKPHRLGNISARIVRDGIEIGLDNAPSLTLTHDAAKRLAACLAACLADIRWARRPCIKEPGNGG